MYRPHSPNGRREGLNVPIDSPPDDYQSAGGRIDTPLSGELLARVDAMRGRLDGSLSRACYVRGAIQQRLREDERRLARRAARERQAAVESGFPPGPAPPAGRCRRQRGTKAPRQPDLMPDDG